MANKSNPSESNQLIYRVRLPKNHNKKFSLLRFNTKVDFSKDAGPVKIERENNFKEFKISNDIETMPAYGAGSEFGREQREQARRKMLGYRTNKYNPEQQPWLMSIGQNKNSKKYVGKKTTTNASYYIFCQTTEGYFDAFPLDDWYNFTPVVKYNHLTSEEAEEEFLKRDKRLNHFNIMVTKRLNAKKAEDDDDEKEEKASKSVKKKKDKKSFILTEMDEWSDGNESAGNDDSDEEKIGKKDSDDEGQNKRKKQREGANKKKDKDLFDEANEDSDDKNEGEEMDYITDTDSEDEDMYADNTKSEKYEMKGVAEEEGMRKILDSDEEEEEEKKEVEEPEVEENKIKKEGVESESETSADSGSDSDIDKEPLPSALLMQQKKKKDSNENTPSSSRSATPTNDKKKRKNDEADESAAKRSRNNTPTPPLSSQGSATDGVSEEAVRRYLMRKPMTVKDLMIKLHKNTGIPKDQVAGTVGAILKKINPEKIKSGDKLFFHLKKN